MLNVGALCLSQEEHCYTYQTVKVSSIHKGEMQEHTLMMQYYTGQKSHYPPGNHLAIHL